MSRKNVVHIITGLNTGGAEMMLFKLLSAIDRAHFEPAVVSMTDIGSVGEKIQQLAVPVHALEMRRGSPNPLAILELVRLLRRLRPDVIQSWMYHADLIGGLAARLAGGIPIAWGIRQSKMDPETAKRSTIWTAKLCARLSYVLPTRIVCCSQASARVHIELGYDKDKIVVVPNGFDLDTFKAQDTAAERLREMLRVPSSTILVGLIARFDPLKDHRNFIEAAVIQQSRHRNVHYVLCGDDIGQENSQLMDWIRETGLEDRFHLLGRRDDIPSLVAGLDIATSSSCSEGFPNVVGEAMACGVPCVVTDVGDSALIVGDTGKVVPPRDPEGLAQALCELIEMGAVSRRKLGESARKRVEECFSLPEVVRIYEQLYDNLERPLDVRY